MGFMSEALKQRLVKNETKKSYKHLDHSGGFRRSFKGSYALDAVKDVFRTADLAQVSAHRQ